MIERAEADGELSGNRTILEPTSGNTGISLAMIGRMKGYKVAVVMPENVSVERVQLLEAYGAEIISSDGSKGTNGSIEVAQDVIEKRPHDYLMMYQYGNDGNPGAHYETTGPEIIEAIPDIDMFVAGLGTGGTLMGVARRLKEYNPAVKIVAVAPDPDDFISGLRSLEHGFIPPILDISLLDSRMLVGSFEAFQTTKRLLTEEGIFAGVSSGSVVYGAIRPGRAHGARLHRLPAGRRRLGSTSAPPSGPGTTTNCATSPRARFGGKTSSSLNKQASRLFQIVRPELVEGRTFGLYAV